MDSIEQKVKRFQKFLDGLSDFDKMNLGMLISMPNAAAMLSEMQDCEYKDMAVFAIALKALHEPVNVKQVLGEEQ